MLKIVWYSIRIGSFPSPFAYNAWNTQVFSASGHIIYFYNLFFLSLRRLSKINIAKLHWPPKSGNAFHKVCPSVRYII